MAKELPYFKFEPNQWENGNVQYFNRSIKGLFIDLCSMYWSRLGELDYALALQKLCGGNTTELEMLMQKEIFVIQDEKIVIEFLDEQLNEFQETSEKRTKAANKRWKNKGKNANALQDISKSNAIREDKSKEDKINNIDSRKQKFASTLKEYSSIYSRDMLKAFYDYWTETNKTNTKFRQELEKTWGLKRRLENWSKNDKTFNSNKPQPEKKSLGI